MNSVPHEFDDEDVVEDDINDEEPAVEPAEEYGYEEPSTDVPAPDENVADQNPGYEVN